MELAAPPVELMAHTHRPTFIHTQMHVFISSNRMHRLIVQVHHKICVSMIHALHCWINQLSDSVRVLKEDCKVVVLELSLQVSSCFLLP